MVQTYPSNPFIGTAVHGHTFPGATRPNAMVQFSPGYTSLGLQVAVITPAIALSMRLV